MLSVNLWYFFLWAIKLDSGSQNKTNMLSFSRSVTWIFSVISVNRSFYDLILLDNCALQDNILNLAITEQPIITVSGSAWVMGV